MTDANDKQDTAERSGATACSTNDLILDVSAEESRALHRVVRAMHDGHCPKCGHLDSAEMFQHATSNLHRCPKCGFTVTAREAEKALEVFRPFLLRSVEVFEAWRRSL